MSGTRRPSTPSERVFALLLALFPREFRARFGGDMRELFRDQLHAARTRAGLSGVAELWLGTIPSLTRAAVLERWEALRELREQSAATTTNTTHTVGSAQMLENLWTDLRFAGRMLRKSPVFTIVAVLCISVGSGAVTTIFSAANALMLRPVPGTGDPERLVRIERVRRDGTGGFLSTSYPYYEQLRERSRTFDGVAAWGKLALTMSAGGEGTATYGNLVSGNFFSVLGVRPALGRFFAPDEDRTPLTHPVVVVSEAFWRSRLGADSAAVGRTILVNGHPFTLIGVAPAEFRGLDAPIRSDAWVPLMMQGQLRQGQSLTDAGAPWLRLAARLKNGVSAEAARQELLAFTAARAGAAADPPWFATYDDFRVSVLTGLPSDATRSLSGFLGLLLGAAALVLLIASVNVASMLSARAIARRREMTVRAALGAGRARLVRQLLTEILVLFLLGAFGGVVLALQATSALEHLQIPGVAVDVALSLELSPDLRVLAFALVVSLVTGLVFGLAPALQAARTDIAARLRDDSAATTGARRTVMGNALIIGQLAFSLVLLVAAGLFLRALKHGASVDPGFDPAGVAVATFNTEAWGYDEAKGRAFFGALRERVEALPGVAAVSYTAHLPLTAHHNGDEIQVDPAAAARAGGHEDRVPVWLSHVDADYLTALRIPVVRGRPIGRADDERAPKVAVVNETLARQFWPDGSAIGRTVRYRDQQVRIVGVARDAKYDGLAEATPPFVYFSLAQFWEPRQSLIVRTAEGAEHQLAPAIQRAVRSLDPALPRPVVSTLREENGIVLLPQRVAAMVTGVLGAVGLLLASVGLYGIIAYSAGRRTREIGIRVALGARRADVLGMIVRDGLWLGGLGVAVGLLLAAAATRLMAGFLFGLSPLDVTTFAGMSALFVAVALVASYLPARRAAASDPMVALRSE